MDTPKTRYGESLVECNVLQAKEFKALTVHVLMYFDLTPFATIYIVVILDSSCPFLYG